MKLYYKPGACSLASHIALREIGADFSLERVDTERQTTESGADFGAINPNGYVPALRLDDDQVLTEGAAILQFIADRKPEAGLAPAAGTLQRARLQEQLNFIASELHSAFGPLFAKTASDEEKEASKARVRRKLDRVEAILADGRDYILGNGYSVADAYLFVVAGWAVPTGIGLGDWPHLAAHAERVASRSPVRDALSAEGLLN